MEGMRNPGARGVSWRDNEVRDLLSFWGEEKIQEILKTSHRNIDQFEKIARQMSARGHKRSALECRTKTKTMRLEYKRVVAHNSRSGNAPTTCAYFKELEAILSGDASVRPKRIARSAVIEVQGDQRNQPLVLQPGSEELFSHEMFTIDAEPLMTSTPAETGTIGPERGNVEEPAEDSDVTIDGLMASGETDSATGRSSSISDREGVECADAADSSANSLPAENAQQKTQAEMSPKSRLNLLRERPRRESRMNTVADKFLRLSETEHMEAVSEHRRSHQESLEMQQRVLLEENRRHREFMEETITERQSFHEAWMSTMGFMKEAVSTLKRMGEVILEPRSTYQADKENDAPEMSLFSAGRPAPPKRACVGRPRERLNI